MKRPLPNNPMQQSEAGGLDRRARYTQNREFLNGVLDPDFPERATGAHVPIWLSPKLARQILEAHGQTGHAIPHPNINLRDITK
jgi:hypothetical protein